MRKLNRRCTVRLARRRLHGRPRLPAPAVDAPAAWRLEEKEARDLANTAWWEQFDDPVLNDLIDDAPEGEQGPADRQRRGSTSSPGGTASPAPTSSRRSAPAAMRGRQRVSDGAVVDRPPGEPTIIDYLLRQS